MGENMEINPPFVSKRIQLPAEADAQQLCIAVTGKS